MPSSEFSPAGYTCFRTPLNGIIGFCEILANKEVDTNLFKKYKKIIDDSSSSLLTIIENILTASKIQIGEVSNSIKTFKVYSLFEEIYENYQRHAINKGLNICIKGIDKINDFSIKADKDKVQEVLSQLVGNAIKFTNSGIVEIGFNKGEEAVFYLKILQIDSGRR